MDTFLEWNIEKYARFIQAGNNNKGGSQQGLSSQSSGKWQLYSSTPNKQMQLSFNRPLNLVLQANDEVLESFNVINSSTWLKAIARNDSMLFLCKYEEKVRRFRIKFSGTVEKGSIDMCKDFCTYISKYINIQMVEPDTDAVGSSGDKSNGSILTIKNVVENVLDKRVFTLPAYYQTSNLQQHSVTSGQSDTSSLIKTCLLDPNFPSFVDSVEKSLKELMECS